jgi:hypothetical protein
LPLCKVFTQSSALVLVVEGINVHLKMGASLLAFILIDFVYFHAFFSLLHKILNLFLLVKVISILINQLLRVLFLLFHFFIRILTFAIGFFVFLLCLLLLLLFVSLGLNSSSFSFLILILFTYHFLVVLVRLFIFSLIKLIFLVVFLVVTTILDLICG